MHAVREVLRERLLSVPWMSEATRIEALKKMGAFGVKIGYPDKWLDFGPLEVGTFNQNKILYYTNK